MLQLGHYVLYHYKSDGFLFNHINHIFLIKRLAWLLKVVSNYFHHKLMMYATIKMEI